MALGGGITTAKSGSRWGTGSASEFDEFAAPNIVAEINITPLTDIFLVLLIIFMVTSSVLSQMGIQVQLPKSTQSVSTGTSPGVLVTVSSSSEIYVNSTKVNDMNIGQVLKAALDKSTDKVVVLEGDRRAVLGTIVRVMDEGKKAGAAKFAIATKNEAEGTQ